MGGVQPAARKGGDSVAAMSNMVFLKAHEDMADTMRLILESTGEGIYGLDPQGRCTLTPEEYHRIGQRLQAAVAKLERVARQERPYRKEPQG